MGLVFHIFGFRHLIIYLNLFQQVVLSIYANYEMIVNEFHVRISNLPLTENVRTLRQLHLNQMVKFYICIEFHKSKSHQIG